MLLLDQASTDACSDPLDHLQVAVPFITCVFHLSVQLSLTEWINEMNCVTIMILLIN
jgi:hypothetical protein